MACSSFARSFVWRHIWKQAPESCIGCSSPSGIIPGFASPCPAVRSWAMHQRMHAISWENSAMKWPMARWASSIWRCCLVRFTAATYCAAIVWSSARNSGGSRILSTRKSSLCSAPSSATLAPDHQSGAARRNAGPVAPEGLTPGASATLASVAPSLEASLGALQPKEDTPMNTSVIEGLSLDKNEKEALLGAASVRLCQLANEDVSTLPGRLAGLLEFIEDL